MINKDRIVEEFMKYVQIDSPTKNEKEFAEFLVKELEDLGFDVYIDNGGEKIGCNTGNVIAKIDGKIQVEPILFSCHMDTVSPSVGVKPIIKDDIIYSDGTTILGGDDKAGIAAVIEALKVIKENNIEHGPIEVVFSVYEEGGLNGAKNLEYDKINSKRAFVLDSGGDPGEIIIQGPAQDKIDVKVLGKSAHAGVSPEEGISAINVAADAISKMNLLRVDKDTTANIGIIEGGSATNIVTPEVNIKAESRSLSDEKLDNQTNHMVETFKNSAKSFDAKVEINVERVYSSFIIDEDDDIVAITKEACEKAGVKPFLNSTGGGSDTNVLNANGIKAVNLGIGERKPHTLEEHMHIKDLVSSAKIVLELIKISTN